MSLAPNCFSSAGDPAEILNWRRWDSQLTTSGQPSEAQLIQIRDLGVTQIVNLGPHSHEKALQNEESSASALGMRYTYIPVDFAAPQEVDFQRYCEAVQSSKGAITHIHCIFNARVTAFLYRYQRDILRADANRAKVFMETVWRPGGVWAQFIGNDEAVNQPNRYVGRDFYVPR